MSRYKITVCTLGDDLTLVGARELTSIATVPCYPPSEGESEEGPISLEGGFFFSFCSYKEESKVVSTGGDKPRKQGLQGREGMKLANPEPWLRWVGRPPVV